MTSVLSALDATFLELEERDHGALMSIGGVMVFDPLPDGGIPTFETVCAGVASRLVALPRYSQRLSSPRTGGLAWPHWVPDERFDIRNHLSRVALPTPGGDRELCDWAADFYSHPLDRGRPLWEMVLIEGLQEGRWAIAHKTHHCLVDGVGSVDVANLLLDEEPRPLPRDADVPDYADLARLSAESLAGMPQPLVQAAQAVARAARGGIHTALHPREGLERSLGLAQLLVRDELVSAPRTSLNIPIGSSRRFAVVNVPLAELKAIRSNLGGTVNDVVLAACTTALRTLLLARGEQPPIQGLRAMVPVNLRSHSEQLALGNRISSLFVELPVAKPTPQARYRVLTHRTAALKTSSAGQAASTVLDLAAFAPPVLHAALARSLYATRLFNVTITNVPGPQTPRYALGARLREVHPVVPLAAEHAVGIAIFSCADVVSFGVIADAESTPDIEVLALGIQEGIEELAALAGEQHIDTMEEVRT